MAQAQVVETKTDGETDNTLFLKMSHSGQHRYVQFLTLEMVRDFELQLHPDILFEARFSPK